VARFKKSPKNSNIGHEGALSIGNFILMMVQRWKSSFEFETAHISFKRISSNKFFFI
jgi:hypothetical protein